MPEALLARLGRGDVVVGDGAWGTVLLDRGLPAGRAPESWTLERPEVIALLAREYVEGGAEIITTNTFGGSPWRLQQHGLGDRIEAINRIGVELALGAAGDRAEVAASVGPTGRLLQPFGDADASEVEEGFARQIEALASGGARLFCIETMTDILEATLAIRAARRVTADATVIATMTFDATPRGPFTVMGVSVAEAARRLQEAGADVIGANCGGGIDAMVEVARAFAGHTRLPVAVRPNAGSPQRRAGRLVYPDTPPRFAERAEALLSAGARIVGGCCGTTPAHIRELAMRVRSPRGPR
jgi:5-methyltetrahydrofolate--homocysteine methyltransferase